MKQLRKVIIVVRQPCLRLGLIYALRDESADSALHFEICEAADTETACSLVEERRPDVVIADFTGTRSDLCALRQFSQERRRAPRTLVISSCDQPYLIHQAFEAEAAGYILACATPSEILRAVTCVLAGDRYLDPRLVTRMMSLSDKSLPFTEPFTISGKGRSDVLTLREVEVLRRIALGYSAKEIARDLDLSQKSVETYKARGAAKLKLESRVQIVRFANEVGWLASAR